MKLNRKLLMATAALVVPISLLATTGVASAKTKTGTGSASCTGITGTIKFSPPLKTTGPYSSETTTTKIKFANCTGGTPSPTKGATVTETMAGAGSTNNCTGLANSMATTLTIKWKGGIAPTVVAFPGYTTGSGGPDNGEGFVLTKGTATGSYAGTGESSSAYSNLSANQLLAACGSSKGLAKLAIVAGTTTV